MASVNKVILVDARLTPIQVSTDGLRELGIEPAGRDKRAATSALSTTPTCGGSGRGGNTATKPTSVKQEDLSTSC